MTRCGMPARFPRTGSACWKETSPKRSFRGFWEKHGPGSCSVTNTSRWMEHCWKLGRRTKASGQSILWARMTNRRRNDQREFVEELRCMGVTPHVAQNQGRRRSRLDQRTTRHPGYEISQRKRKRIEEVFGWMKTVGMLRQLRHRGLERVGWVFTLAAATYNLVRMRTLMPKCV